MKRKMNQKNTPMRSNEPLSFDVAQCWKRMQRSDSSAGEDPEDHFRDLYRQFLNEVMIYDRQVYLRVDPYERNNKRADQANGFYDRDLTSSFGTVGLRVPRSRSGEFQTM